MPYCCMQIIKELRLYCHPNNHHWHQLGKYNWLCMYVGECGSAHRKNNNPVESHFVANKRIIVSTFTHPPTYLCTYPFRSSIRPAIHPPTTPDTIEVPFLQFAIFIYMCILNRTNDEARAKCFEDFNHQHVSRIGILWRHGGVRVGMEPRTVDKLRICEFTLRRLLCCLLAII